MKNLILVASMVILATSCGSLRNNNFSKQKFTDLKQVDNNPTEDLYLTIEVPLELEEDTVSIPCDTLYFLSGKKMSCTILSETDELVTFDNCPPTGAKYEVKRERLIEPNSCDTIYLDSGEVILCKILKDSYMDITYIDCISGTDTFIIDKSKISYTSEVKKEQLIGANNTVVTTASEDAEPTNQKFIPLREREEGYKTIQRASSWNKLFNIGLTIFILTVFSYILAIFILEFLILASIGLLISWIISLRLFTNGRDKNRVFKKEKVNGFNVKYGLASFVAITGIILLSGLAALILITIAF